jgi:hypothetical protein
VRSGDTTRITVGCAFHASSGTVGAASLADGNRTSWSGSGVGVSVSHQRIWYWRSFARDTTVVRGTSKRTIKCASSSDRICGSISETCGPDAIAVTKRKLSGSAGRGRGSRSRKVRGKTPRPRHGSVRKSGKLEIGSEGCGTQVFPGHERTATRLKPNQTNSLLPTPKLSRNNVDHPVTVKMRPKKRSK